MSRSASAMAVLAVVSLVATARAAAQQLPPARLGIGGGLTAPQGAYREDANGEGFNVGWQGMLLIEFRAPRRPIGVRVDVVVGENPANDVLNANAMTPGGQPVTARLRTIGANLDAVYSIGRSPRGGRAYVLGGVGTYRVTYSEASGGLTTDVSENKFAWNAGAGLTYPMGGGALFLEARYFNLTTNFILTGKAPYVALMAGVRFGR